MCDCNENRPAFSETTTPVARKFSDGRPLHMCCECGSSIAAGERYESCRGKWESWTDSTGKRHSGIQTLRTCLACVELRDSLAALDDGCFCFGELAEAVAECRVLPACVAEFTARLESSRKEVKCGSCN